QHHAIHPLSLHDALPISRKTHPSDVVFYYDEPYAVRRTYVNCDLKSYARSSITAGGVLSALESLAESISCIELSDTWRKMYIHEDRKSTRLNSSHEWISY